MNHRARLRKDEVNRAEKCCYICSKSALTSGCTKVVKEWLPFILLKESMCRLSGLRLCSAVSFHFSDFFFHVLFCCQRCPYRRPSELQLHCFCCSLQPYSTTLYKHNSNKRNLVLLNKTPRSVMAGL